MPLLPGRAALSSLAYRLGPARYYAPAYRFIAEDVAPERGAMLDVGCGPAWVAIHAATGRPDLDVVAIDTDQAMLAAADRNRGGRLNVTLRRMDAARIVYPDRTFEIAVAVQSAHHWRDPAAVFAELHRVLVEGGRLYVYEADPASEVPEGWIARRGPWPPDTLVRRNWARFGMDDAAFAHLRAVADASPFSGDVHEDRHGFYRRLVCSR
jgi:SAM-dependent methyltransferase